jgi:hypothetical protein
MSASTNRKKYMKYFRTVSFYVMNNGIFKALHFTAAQEAAADGNCPNEGALLS